jgi:lactoylglutathione lyase
VSSFAILHSADIGRSERFYRDELGFDTRFRWPAKGEPEYLYLEREGSGLGIGRADASAHGVPVRAGAPATFTLCVYVSGIDGLYTRLIEHDVPGRAAPTDQPWGERVAFVEDPDRYPIMLIQRPTEGLARDRSSESS